MSKLSELLNPVPSSNAQGSPIGTLNHDAPADPQDQITKTLTLTQTQAHSPTQKSTQESPLEALANAATSSRPLASPTHPLGTSVASFGAPFPNHPSSRPTSSRISPPLPTVLPHQPEHPLGAFSPGLEQYHHSSSHEVKARRLSDITDGTSRTLPPLRRSLPDESIKTATPLPPEQFEDGVNDLHNTINAEPPQLSPEILAVKPEQESDTTDDPHAIPRRPSEPSQPLSSTPSTNLQSGEVEVKTETMETSEVLQGDVHNDGGGEQREGDMKASRRSSVATELALPRNVQELKRDLSYQPSSAGTEASTPGTLATPKPAPSRKRAAPKPKVEKKGTASAVKPLGKRRKIETRSVDGTPPLPKSGTPASSRASKTPAPRNQKQKSATPARSSSIAMPDEDEEEEEDDGDEEEDNELFCICRKPDDHTWMIACDGPCQDWFHGRCVGIDEKDGNLIDKYICPNCKANSDSQTTWKPMCRLETCRDPARVTGNKPSKYCSDEHGMEYMRNRALKGEPAETRVGGSKTSKKRKRDNNTDSGNIEDDAEVDDTPSYLRGGVLRAAELKALSGSVNDISEFRKLGEGVLSPPRTVSPDGDMKMEDAGDAPTKPKVTVSYSTEESNQLNEIATKLEALKTRKSLLSDREKFLGLVKARAKAVLDELRRRDTDLKKKETIKDICGYDARLSWSDEEFDHWRSSPEGQKTLNGDAGVATLGPAATPMIPSLTQQHPATGAVAAAAAAVADEDATEPSAAPHPSSPTTPHPKSEDTTAPSTSTATVASAATDEPDTFTKGTCHKRHCARHRAWWKLHQQELAFEKEEVRLGARRLEEEEKGVRGRGMIRFLEGGVDGGGKGGEG